MKSFKDFQIDEGVVKVPPKMYKKLTDFTWKSALSLAWDKTQKRKEQEPQWYNWYMKQAKKYGVKGQSNQDNFKASFNYEIKNMPVNYPREKVKRLNYIISTGDSFIKGKGGHFNAKKNEIEVSIGQMDFDFYPFSNNGYDKKNFAGSMESILVTLQHELMHSVQFNLLKPTAPEQANDNNYFLFAGASKKSRQALDDKYGKGTAKRFTQKAYYTSQLEFDPQIVSSLDDIKTAFDVKQVGSEKLSNEDKINIFKKMTVITPSKKGFGQRIDDPITFFEILKKEDKEQWKLAVKKIYLLAIKQKLIKSIKGFKL